MKGKYQKKDVSLDEVIKNIRVEQNTRIFLVVSPCRSASTVLLRVFGASGIQSHFQELKNVLRWLMQGEAREFNFPGMKNEIMIKETLGPFTEAECSFNPLEVLIKAGVSPENIHLVLLGREPYQTWASWVDWWENKTDVELFKLSYLTTEKIRIQAEELNVKTTIFMYDIFREKGIEDVFRKLFEKLNIEFSPLAVGGWETLPGFGMDGSNIILPVEPSPFITPDIHTTVEKSERYVYMSKDEEIGKLNKSDIEKIDKSPLHNIYESWLNLSKKDLG